ncbi:chemotaxis protein CheW [Teichococcus vastitatis]|uniref:Chemotaxis protein CheW n=1 Tax=Teichococcus vastitatis TaxID=2307076 RepID=A0ABS9W9L4_9PROT|nr:chemotaxis protein CheW [Pseudoroseomonas vastitatis]MCI0755990.1 chemotaxis protein CheW [Pseudoroseomonas vastitatis]
MFRRSHPLNPAAAVSASAEAYLVLQLGARRCALSCAAVREILPLPRLWRPPGLPRPLAGFLNLSGEAVPVLDLARLFGLSAETADAEAALYRHVILASPGPQGALPGLLVDRVLDLVRVPPAGLRPLAGDASLNGCAVAELPLADGFAHLLAPERILLAQEQARLATLREAAQTRLQEWGEPS